MENWVQIRGNLNYRAEFEFEDAPTQILPILDNSLRLQRLNVTEFEL